MRREFPALGFDPAPGDPVAVSAAAGSVAQHGRVFADASGSVSRLDTGSWVGDAGDGFRGQLRDLPRDLEVAGRSHGTAAQVLAGYGRGLQERQRHADELEARAAELARLRQTAVAEVNALAGQRAPRGSAELTALQGRYESARRRLTGFDGELQAVVAQARRLHGDHQQAAESAAREMRRLADHAPYDKPGLLSRLRDKMHEWTRDPVEMMCGISGVLKGVSAALGLLSMVPGLQILAPFAMLTGAMALGIDATLKVTTGRGSWKSLAIDTVLSVMPWGRVAGLLHRAPTAARLLDTAGDSGREVDVRWAYRHVLRVDDSRFAQAAVRSLERVPKAYHARVIPNMFPRNKNAGIYIGNRPITELGYDTSHLGSPRGWPPGSRWADVGGVYIPAEPTMLVGSKGGPDTALHEFGHAVDDALGDPSQGKVFAELHGQIAKCARLEPYLTQLNGAGQEELFAEAFAWRYESGSHETFQGSKAAATLLRRYFDRLEGSL